MPAHERPICPPGEDSLWVPIRDTVSARISPAQNLPFWWSIGHYSYDKIADHSGGYLPPDADQRAVTERDIVPSPPRRVVA